MGEQSVIMERNWTSVGAEFREGDDQTRLEAAIDALEWESVEGSKPAMPGLCIKDVIAQLRIPKVDLVAYRGGGDLTYPDGDSGGRAYYALYGIQGHYKNGRARVYVLDQGGVATPVCSDFWPNVEGGDADAGSV